MSKARQGRSVPRRPQKQTQVAHVRTTLRNQAALPFAALLPPEPIAATLAELDLDCRERVFPPAVTIWAFLSQTLEADPSCANAVARTLAWRLSRGLPACSARTGGYCRARQRLPEAALSKLLVQQATEVEAVAPREWLFHGRHVKMVDGATFSMPDTRANRRAYPLPPNQKKGVGFPLARMVVLIALATGVVLSVAQQAYVGSSEARMFVELLSGLQGGDILLGDRGFCSVLRMMLLRGRGVDSIFRLHPQRQKTFRRQAKRLGRDDWLVTWPKPSRPAWMEARTYGELPAELQVRIIRRRIRIRGFRSREIYLATTLLDRSAYPADELAGLYRQRWQVELDLRSIKSVMQMDVLRGQTPAMVRREVSMHLLAYNLIRKTMAQAAREAQIQPRQLSFKGAVQLVNAFAPLLATARPAQRERLRKALYVAIASHRVGDRPDRHEPRRRRRRPKAYPLLQEPRVKARRRLTKERAKA